jgi:hypothetical protein
MNAGVYSFSGAIAQSPDECNKKPPADILIDSSAPFPIVDCDVIIVYIA